MTDVGGIVAGSAAWGGPAAGPDCPIMARRMTQAGPRLEVIPPGTAEHAALMAGGGIGPYAPEFTQEDLLRMAKATFDARLQSGVIEVDVGAPGEPVLVMASVDPAKLSPLMGAMNLAQANVQEEFSWTATVNGAPADVMLVGAQLIAIAQEVSTQYQAMRAALNNLRAAIVAGSVSTPSEIEGYAWPV